MNKKEAKKIIETITPREMQVVKLICREYTNQEIGDKLELSRRTVESHRVRIMEKLKVTTTIGLVVFAFSYGIMKPKK